MLKPELIEHSLAPIFDERSRVLILGTMPSPKSREVGFYYGHPQNRFWKVMGALFNEPEPIKNEERRAFLLQHGIALWDVLTSCTITGASDASITNPVPNDLARIATHASLAAICTTGKQPPCYIKTYPPICFQVSPTSAYRQPAQLTRACALTSL